jgi:ABC-type antimicrobial peptide transport system permease subunit
LGLFALILATVGMWGVFAYVVQQRTKEIGIRMALGARPPQVIRLVLGGSSRAVMIGLAAGFGIALPMSRLMRNVLYGVSPLDPIAYLSVASILAVAGIAASYAPARRASRVDPVGALRHE